MIGARKCAAQPKRQLLDERKALVRFIRARIIAL